MSKHGSAMLSIGLGAAILYLGAQAVTGRQGLVAYVDLQAQERALEDVAAAVVTFIASPIAPPARRLKASGKAKTTKGPARPRRR